MGGLIQLVTYFQCQLLQSGKRVGAECDQRVPREQIASQIYLPGRRLTSQEVRLQVGQTFTI